MKIATIIVIILTFLLWRLYHKLFRVVYFNFGIAFIRELLVCFVISCLIVGGGANAIGVQLFDDDESRTSQPSDPVYFYNLQFLDGGGYDTSINFQDSRKLENGICVSGSSICKSKHYSHSFSVDIPRPETNTFSFPIPFTETEDASLTITYHPDENTLSVVQEAENTDEPTPYTGEYTNSDIWWNELSKQVFEAKQDETDTSKEINYWVQDYFGSYISLAYDQGEEGAVCLNFSIYPTDYSTSAYSDEQPFFQANFAIANQPQSFTSFYVPYPLGKSDSKLIDNGIVGFEVLGLSDDGRQLIEVTKCSYPEHLGIYIQGEFTGNEQPIPTSNEMSFQESETGLNEEYDEDLVWDWNGFYICNNGGEDGIKAISVLQIDDTWLNIELDHIYADGREDYMAIDAEIGTYGNGRFFASYEQERTLYFTLTIDPESGYQVVRVDQHNISIDTDQEFNGIYIKETV